MKNVEIKVEGDKCVIILDLSKRLGPSASGKTQIVASTGGNVEVPGRPEIKLGINAYTK